MRGNWTYVDYNNEKVKNPLDLYLSWESHLPLSVKGCETKIQNFRDDCDAYSAISEESTRAGTIVSNLRSHAASTFSDISRNISWISGSITPNGREGNRLQLRKENIDIFEIR